MTPDRLRLVVNARDKIDAEDRLHLLSVVNTAFAGNEASFNSTRRKYLEIMNDGS